MPGRNRFDETIALAGRDFGGGICVFISHQKADKVEASEVAEAFLTAGVDIYFDEDDECLAGASEETDPEKVVRCIDAGLSRSTHLLGLITPNTRGSWWVPYEIGVTRARSVGSAFIVHPDVKSLPAYVRVSTILPDRRALAGWIPSIKATGSASVTAILLETINRLFLTSDPKFLPAKRDVREITFE